MPSKQHKLIVISNRLPFYKVTDETGTTRWKQATGGLITALDPVLRKTRGVWLGWDGSAHSSVTQTPIPLIDVREIDTHEHLLGDEPGYYYIGNIPISAEEVEEYYNRFSNGTLWSLFHYFFEKSSINYASWNAYYEVNYRFAQHLESVTTPDDIIWVHDFHLFLVPFFLRKLRPQQMIHFFLHIPFPHLDIFSIIPWHKQILESLLCCNTVGFHHKQYLRNAREAVKLYKKEKLSTGTVTIEDGIDTRFYVNPISIDFDRFDTTARSAEVIARKEEIRTQCGCPHLLLGVDRLDYSKGIKERLLALEHLLEEHQELKGQLAYYQVAVPSRENVEAYQTLKKEVDEIIGRINGKFSTGVWSPIHYIYNVVTFEELVALYSAADIALVTPLRDGMNLVCKEYIASHADNDGVLILSKFAGAIAEIKNCLSINPYSIEDMSSAIYCALHMSLKERNRRMIKMRRNIRLNNIQSWLKNCLDLFNIN
ncbi:MAG: trehalose-6-phosphate synthase [Candidatus Omnitrophica bacterium]|nr:trehalose-6-phosphate synthase [Candidatus Omnitrophota bacterium]